MKKICVSFLILLTVCIGQAQTFKFQSKNVEMTLDNQGYVVSLKVCKQELLRERQPFAITFHEDEFIVPFMAEELDGMLAIKMRDGGRLFFDIKSTEYGLTAEVTTCSESYNTLLLCPFVVNLNEEVGEMSGYAKGGKIAFGMHALNAKTCAGTPAGHTHSIRSHFRYDAKDITIPCATIPAAQLAATPVAGGTRFQHYCCRRNDSIQHPWQSTTRFPYYLSEEDNDVLITGAKLEFWGCNEKDLYMYLGRTSEKTEGFIASLDSNNLDRLLNECQAANASYLFFDNLFVGSGTYQWNTNVIPSDSVWKEIQAKAADKGILLGASVSVGKVSTHDPLLTPIPSKRILKEEASYLTEPLDAKQEAFCIEDGDMLKTSKNWNILQIDDELILFNSIEEDETGLYLNGCTRGAFGTKAQVHDITATIYKLWVEADSTLRADLIGQDEMAISLATRCNEAGLQCLILDGTENLQITGHGDYALSRFLSVFYSHLKKDMSVFPDQFTHYRQASNWQSTPFVPVIHHNEGDMPQTVNDDDFYKRNRLPVLSTRRK